VTSPQRSQLNVVIVCGNPRPNSRTLAVAHQVADAAVASLGAGAGLAFEVSTHTIDLSNLGGQLFDWSSEAVKAEVAAFCAADFAVVASPTFKATYTGLLKSFLDWFDQTALSKCVVVPVMVGGNPVHALAPEVFLRPLLVEVGAIVPTRGLFIIDTELDHIDDTLAAWSAVAAPALRKLLL
jgi:FMN reductase